MSVYNVTLPLRATGSINVSSFFKIDPANYRGALQAVVGDLPDGIIQAGTQDAPGTFGASVFGAYPAVTPNSGGAQAIFFGSDGMPVQLQAGIGGWTAGDLLKPDANGFGVTAALGDKYGAKAMSTALVGEKHEVIIRRGVR